MRVEVAYVGKADQALVRVIGGPDLTVNEAIVRSGLLARFPEIDLGVHKVGIHGRLTTLDQTLAEGDRVEIYRPLIADPREQRKKRAAEGRIPRKGGGGNQPPN